MPLSRGGSLPPTRVLLAAGVCGALDDVQLTEYFNHFGVVEATVRGPFARSLPCPRPRTASPALQLS